MWRTELQQVLQRRLRRRSPLATRATIEASHIQVSLCAAHITRRAGSISGHILHSLESYSPFELAAECASAKTMSHCCLCYLHR